jgi:hypothetical protein
MDSKQFSFRFGPHTQEQLADLLTWTGLTQTQLLAIAIDRLWQAERKRRPRDETHQK